MRPAATYSDPEYHSDHWFGPFAMFKDKYNEVRGVAAFDAFASGHTGAIFAMATVFSEEYKDYKAMPFILYSVAGAVGITRLIEHEHWASDVFLGAIIGYLCGKQVVAGERRLFRRAKISQGGAGRGAGGEPDRGPDLPAGVHRVRQRGLGRFPRWKSEHAHGPGPAMGSR